jgi:NADH-quinone oxidoreductase subunit E
MSKSIGAIIDSYQHDRGQLVAILQEIQSEYLYLKKEALEEVSQVMGIPLSQIYSVATFFKAFSLKPRGRHLINVCLGTACHVRGAARVLEKMERDLGIDRGETTRDLKFTLETVNCVGCCAQGPMVKVNEGYFGQMKSNEVSSLLARYE